MVIDHYQLSLGREVVMHRTNILLLGSAVGLIITFAGVARGAEVDNRRQSQGLLPAVQKIRVVAVITDPSVQEKLHLNNEQKSAIERMVTEGRKARQTLRKLKGDARQKQRRELSERNHALLEKTLTAAQRKQLSQIQLTRAAQALGDPLVAKQLKLSPEQTAQIKKINQGSGNAAVRMTRGLSVLTSEQQKQWKQFLPDTVAPGDTTFSDSGRPGDIPGEN